MDRQTWADWMDVPLWGMVHLAPLPGSPRADGGVDRALTRALADAEALVEAGYHGIVVENFGDLPFYPERIPAVTVACMARIASALRECWPELRIGINCLRNDADAALAVAVASGADAIRVNVHAGAAVTDQGLLQGKAAETLRRRRELGAESVLILADVAVKHAAPLGPTDLTQLARDLRYRGLADALLVTGWGTGEAAFVEDLERVRAAVPDAPVLVASGVDRESAALWARIADGAIVGSDLMHEGHAGGGVDPDRARALLVAYTKGRRSAGKPAVEA